MPGTENKTDSVAFMFETEHLTDEQVNEIKAVIRKQVQENVGVDVGFIQSKRFNSDHGGVVIYQP